MSSSPEARGSATVAGGRDGAGRAGSVRLAGGSAVSAAGGRAGLAGALGVRRALQRRSRPVARALRGRPSAAERDRRAAHGPRPAARARRTRSSAGTGCGASTSLFQPGYDHAGISTQNVVEKELAAEGLTRQRARPRGLRASASGTGCGVRRDDHGPVPPDRRLARLPARALHDGRRVRARGHALLRAPLRTGWIYRANRIVNWCPFHQTALSDLELVHVEVDDDARATSATRSPTARATSRRDRRARPRSSPTSRSQCIRATSATATSSARRSSSRSSSAACRSSPTSASSRSSARARSRSRRVTIRSTSRSAATTGSPSRW